MPKKAEPTGFGERLKAVREAAGLTQDELAERAGLYKFSIAKIEQGVREPTWSTVQALAKALDVDCTAFQAADASPSATGKRTPTDEPAGKKGKKKGDGER